MTQVWEYIKIALMNIRSNKGRSILTMLGIIIGISSVIMIISIGNGVKSGINGELNSMAGGQIAVYSNNTAENGTEVIFTEEDMDAIQEKVPNVKAVTPSWSFSGSATGRKGTFDATATFGKAGLEYSIQDPIIKGRYFTDSDYYTANKVCVITESSAKTLFGNTNVIGMSFDYTLYGVTQEFTIVGIRKDNASKLFGMGGNGTVTIEAPISTISDGYGFYVEYTDLLIVSDGAENAAQVAKDVVRLLENRHGVRGQNAILVQNFNDIMSQMDQILSYITIFVVWHGHSVYLFCCRNFPSGRWYRCYEHHAGICHGAYQGNRYPESTGSENRIHSATVFVGVGDHHPSGRSDRYYHRSGRSFWHLQPDRFYRKSKRRNGAGSQPVLLRRGYLFRYLSGEKSGKTKSYRSFTA